MKWIVAEIGESFRINLKPFCRPTGTKCVCDSESQEQVSHGHDRDRVHMLSSCPSYGNGIKIFFPPPPLCFMVQYYSSTSVFSMMSVPPLFKYVCGREREW